MQDPRHLGSVSYTRKALGVCLSLFVILFYFASLDLAHCNRDPVIERVIMGRCSTFSSCQRWHNFTDPDRGVVSDIRTG